MKTFPKGFLAQHETTAQTPIGLVHRRLFREAADAVANQRLLRGLMYAEAATDSASFCVFCCRLGVRFDDQRTNQSLSVSTTGCPGALCQLKNDKRTWYVASTPGSVTIHRAYGDLTVMCKKEGFPDATAIRSPRQRKSPRRCSGRFCR